MNLAQRRFSRLEGETSLASEHCKRCDLIPNEPLDEIGKDLIEFTVHSFIVKIWLEETTEEAGQAVWRGHITHVPSGKRRYLNDLQEILDFIVPYLEQMGVKSTLRRRVRRWLNR